ncbi:MAG: hypothetical protein ABJG68_00110 [Crocinitomicaceae bacterium]
MKIVKFIAILGVGVLLLKSCIPEAPIPDQEKIYLELSFAYNKSLSKSTATATFRQDSKTGAELELTNPANILYDSNLLIFNTDNSNYKKELIGKIEAAFVYTDLDNEVITNSVTLNDSIDFLALADSHAIGSNLIVPITAPNFLSEERLEVILRDLTSGHEIVLNSDSIPTTDMMIESSHLMEIGLGEMIITLRRIKEHSTLTESKDAGGDLKICYEVQDTLILF